MLPVRSGGRLSVSPLALVPGDADVSPVARPALVSAKRAGKPTHTAGDAGPILAAAGISITAVVEEMSNGASAAAIEPTTSIEESSVSGKGNE